MTKSQLGIYSSPYRLPLNSTLAATHAQVSSIRQIHIIYAQMQLWHFIEHLVGAPLGLKKWGMGAM